MNEQEKVKKRGVLFTITAPSGAGKTSLVAKLTAADPNIKVSVSHTTRSQRPGEKDGVDYHFVDKDRFMKLLNAGDFLECAEVYGNHYGTSQAWVEEQLSAGINVILEIDWQGAEQVRRLVTDACGIFILPPSLESLRQRLTDRGQDAAEVIERRMQKAKDELSHIFESKYVVINDDFSVATEELQAIIRAEGLLIGHQEARYTALLNKISS